MFFADDNLGLVLAAFVPAGIDGLLYEAVLGHVDSGGLEGGIVRDPGGCVAVKMVSWLWRLKPISRLQFSSEVVAKQVKDLEKLCALVRLNRENLQSAAFCQTLQVYVFHAR